MRGFRACRLRAGVSDQADPAKAFTPVAMIGSGPNALVIYPGLPVGSVKQLIALARAKPGRLNNANAGIGSFQHLKDAGIRAE